MYNLPSQSGSKPSQVQPVTIDLQWLPYQESFHCPSFKLPLVFVCLVQDLGPGLRLTQPQEPPRLGEHLDAI